MNVYVVTEGKVESEVYKHWIPFVNEDLSLIDHLSDINLNNFYLVSARGYPDYFDVIDSAINDVNDQLNFDLLYL